MKYARSDAVLFYNRDTPGVEAVDLLSGHYVYVVRVDESRVNPVTGTRTPYLIEGYGGYWFWAAENELHVQQL